MEIFWSQSLKITQRAVSQFQWFIQRMANRIMQGQARYGEPKPGHQWMKRARLELSAYSKSGNAEHLLNAANYCYLESLAPEHKKYHFNNEIESASRGKRGIKETIKHG